MNSTNQALLSQFQLHLIKTTGELSAAFQGGLIDLYQQIFSEPPEYQVWTPQAIEQMFVSYLNEGQLLLATNSEKRYIGFCAIIPLERAKVYRQSALNLTTSSSIQLDARYLASLGANPVLTWYVADLGIASSWRHQGMATLLLQQAIALTPAETEHILLRVSLSRTNAIALYESLGFTRLNLRQETEYLTTDGSYLKATKTFMLLQRKLSIHF